MNQFVPYIISQISDNIINLNINGVSLDFIQVKAGEIILPDESKLSIDKDFYMAKYPVTQQLWKCIIDKNPSVFKHDEHPIENVSIEDVDNFIDKLNNLTHSTFRLPNSQEWEFAARGGILSKGYKYPGGNDLSELAPFHKYEECDSTSMVSKFEPNELGIYDLAGNVSEICSDETAWKELQRIDKNSVEKDEVTIQRRIVKGASWYNKKADYFESSESKTFPYNCVDRGVGFRLVL